MLQQSMANTRINTCRLCGLEATEKWENPQYQTLNFLGEIRKFMVDPGHWETILINGICPECNEREELRNEKEKAEKAVQKTIEKGIEIMGGEYAYKNYRFDSYTPKTESQKEALKICKEFDPSNDNIYLVGPTGVGKTHLACSIALTSMPRLLSAKRWKVTELLRHIRTLKSAPDEENEINLLSNCPLLILEDIGAQKETDWGNSILWEILDNRIDKGINGLVITSNVGRGMLASTIGERIPSRISSLCRVVKIEGSDYRVTKGA